MCVCVRARVYACAYVCVCVRARARASVCASMGVRARSESLSTRARVSEHVRVYKTETYNGTDRDR